MLRHRLVFAASWISLLVACSHAPSEPSTAQNKPGRIDHLVVMVFDQMRPDYIDRFKLPHFRELRSRSVNYSGAYLGYMGAETVVTHIVIPTGLKPSSLPWQDDFFYDKAGRLGNGPGFYPPGELGMDKQLEYLREIPEERFLPLLLKKKFGGTVYAVGEKDYAATDFGTPAADSLIMLEKKGGTCHPAGLNVPSYISGNERFTLECTKKYGTEKAAYSLDGSKFVPGDDPKHLGGDVWVTDVAKELMNHENWTGLFLTYGAIDKIGHQLGEEDGKRPPQTRGVPAKYDLAAVNRIADEQLGRVIDELRKRKLLDRTLIVVTADHGGQTDYDFLGNGKDQKWETFTSGSTAELPKWIEHFVKPGDVAFSFQDTAIRTWLKPGADPARTVRAMSDIPEVTEIYVKREDNGHYRYERAFSRLDKESARFRKWAEAHTQEIVDAMACEISPDIVGLLRDRAGFGLVGDHGGAQENVQRVPLMFLIPGEKGRVDASPIRAYEIKGEIEKRMGIEDRYTDWHGPRGRAGSVR